MVSLTKTRLLFSIEKNKTEKATAYVTLAVDDLLLQNSQQW
jgi:hypothetical protein